MSHPVGARFDDFRPLCVLFECADALGVYPRVPEHAAVCGDERHTRFDERRKADGLCLEAAGGCGRLIALDLVRHEPRLEQHPFLDPVVHVVPQRPEQQAGGDERREDAGPRPGQEHLRPEARRPHGLSRSLYPNCGTVTMASAMRGSFSRNRRTWTSTVRVPPV